ncbi:NAD(P)-dependent oxidoreductase [Ruania alkalisoli]|uniref:NAD(P)-dependent oxidoreductase n=1 Tax=Ruania alkalisoli TaxID=2779775 RepID=A0A7M1SQ92_9MICO|nr:NAD(P)-dependent oxidoreductase [Ruania alkalisoli]QOR69710.1 NAD(P)-dependent oxidoreductase [Ruania alkalisoli]
MTTESGAPSDDVALEHRLSSPSPALVQDAAHIDDDLVILGAGGKMGPTLAMMARRALDEAGRRDVAVHAVSRWSDTEVRERLESAGVSTVVADLASPGVESQLPDGGHVVFMVGAKFGVTGQEYRAWLTNAALPHTVTQRYPQARISALSTGNVYPLTDLRSPAPDETSPTGPVGEYAMSCLGRERVFEAAAATRGTRLALVRLNYAVEPRYGVFADLARTILDGRPVDLTTGFVNVVWQRYANEVVLRSLLHASAPEPFRINLTGPETLSVRTAAETLAAALGTEVTFEGQESDSALLADATRCHELFGYPDVPARTLIGWQADWIEKGGQLWDKPTKFQRRDGQF